MPKHNHMRMHYFAISLSLPFSVNPSNKNLHLRETLKNSKRVSVHSNSRTQPACQGRPMPLTLKELVAMQLCIFIF